MDSKTTILGIDPGTSHMGIAVIRNGDLAATGVHTLRNGERPHDVIGQAKRIVLRYIRDFSPAVVAIEKPLRMKTKRAALMCVIVQELNARSRELGLEVQEIWPHDVRDRVTGDPYAKKIDVARVIVEKYYPSLWPKLPVAPRRAALGFRPRDKYWLHMFDALAVALAVVGVP